MQRSSRRSRKLIRKQRVLTLERLDSRFALAADGIEFLVANEACSAEDVAFNFDDVGATSTKTTKTTSSTSNAAPTLAKPVSTVGSVTSTSTRVTLSVLGADDQGEKKLTYTWSKVSGPGATLFSANSSNAAKKTNVTFSAAGTYQLRVTVRDAAGLQTNTNYSVTIAPTVSKVVAVQNGTTLANGVQLKTAESQLNLRLVALDQFNNPIASPGNVTWAVSKPSGSAPTLAGTTDVSITFERAGAYQFKATVGGKTTTVKVTVEQSLRSIAIDPAATLAPGAAVQLRAQSLDQFNRPMTKSPTISWATSGGSISSSGRLTAPNAAGNLTVTATSGAINATVTVSVQALPNFGGFQDNALASLIQTSFADGSISRSDMIAILRQAGVDGSVSTAELSDMRSLVSDAQRFAIPDYVRSLADDVVNANLANATYQGTTLGNLAAGSSAAQLNKLIDKWFLGADRPTLTSNSYVYRAASGNVFNGDPSYTHQLQGALGDCYLIATVGMVAMAEPDAIRNMFIDNGDGTFTVRFYAGTYGAFYAADGSLSDGFTSGVGVAEYVTVDRWLPATAWGNFAYSSGGGAITSTNNTLWIALIEKAYAQWNATGSSGRSQVANSYASIEGGWMSRVNAQVLGYNSNNYSLTSGNKQRLIDALQNDRAVTFGTKASGQSGSLVGSHAYGIRGYDAGTDRFQLYNPWGSFQPGALSYSDLQSFGTYFVVADASDFTSNVASLSVRGVRSDEMGDVFVDLQSVSNTQLVGVETNQQNQLEREFVVDSQDQPMSQTILNGPLALNETAFTSEIAEDVSDETAPSESRLFATLEALDAYFAELADLC